jgi:MacB-like periplasmic core domain/FtsX-like permease family
VSLAWYRFRGTFRRRWTGYLAVVLLVGLVGGVAMGAIAGARRTQSAFPAYLAASNASELTMQASSNASQFTPEQIEKLGQHLAHLPRVTRLAVAPNLFVVPLGPKGRPLPAAENNDDVTAIGSEDGEYFTQDRLTVATGRMADPTSPSEMVATAEAAKLGGWHVGETVLFGGYTLQQADSPDFNFATEPPSLRFSAKLVGLVVFPSQVVNDDVDRYPTFVLLTPALTARLRATQVYPSFAFRLAHGSADVPVVEKEIIGLLPQGTTYTFHVTSVAEGEVERSSKPEAIALGVFGGIAGLAALLIAGLAVARGISAQDDELDALRALGADPFTLTWDLMFGVLGAIVLGALLAVGVAIVLSPLAPIGPAHQIDPHPGFAADWTVLATGLAVMTVGLGLLTAALAYRAAARRHVGPRSERVERGSHVVNAAARSGLPPSAVAGLRFALEPGHGRTSVPVRSALVGAVLAVVVVVTTLTFASGLNSLDSHPALYGWNWNYAINPEGGDGSVPPAAAQLLSRDPEVAAWTGYTFAGVQIDGQTVPVLLAQTHAELNPPILSGHALEATNEIVLGAATLAALHKKVGDTVTVSYGSPSDAPIYVAPTPLRVVGTATLPAIGTSGALHPSMGTGAMIPDGIGSPAFKKALKQSDPNLNGHDVEVVRFRRGVTTAAGLASLHKIITAADRVMAADPQGQGDVYEVLGVQRPAEIVNYQSTGATPDILATGLAVGAVVALGLTLATSVRRRRRDFALLKTLGFTRYQLAVTVAWQASVAALVGIVIGVPLGIALGRWLWDLFARGIYAVPKASVPIVEVVLVALAALVLANLVAAVPGVMAARTRTALALRAE